MTEICIAEGAMAEQADYMPIYDVVITKHLLRGGSHVSLSTMYVLHTKAAEELPGWVADRGQRRQVSHVLVLAKYLHT